MGKMLALSDATSSKPVTACQLCGSAERLTYWQECDEQDRSQSVFVVLCRGCADRVIGPHPRLYRQQPASAVLPGVMPICVGCPQQRASRCMSPLTRFNGGPGITFEPKPSVVQVCSRGRGGISGSFFVFESPATCCSGRAAAEAEEQHGQRA